MCTFANNDSVASLSLALCTRTSEAGQFHVLKIPISKNDEGLLMNEKNVYKLPRIMQGQVLFYSGSQWILGTVQNIQMELNSAGSFLKWLYSILQEPSKTVITTDENNIMPVYVSGDSLIVKDGLNMWPGVVTAVSETNFDEFTITVVNSKQKINQRRTIWTLKEMLITASYNIAPVNFSSVI